MLVNPVCWHCCGVSEVFPVVLFQELPRAIQCTVFSPNESTSVLLADAVDQEHLQCLAAAISQECRKAPALPLLAGSAVSTTPQTAPCFLCR